MSKVKQNFNQLSPAETERLALLMEELGEAQQVIGKILRHGYGSFHPDDPEQTTNRRLLESELGDVQAALQMMLQARDLSPVAVTLRTADKLRRVESYLHHNSVCE